MSEKFHPDHHEMVRAANSHLTLGNPEGEGCRDCEALTIFTTPDGPICVECSIDMYLTAETAQRLIAVMDHISEELTHEGIAAR